MPKYEKHPTQKNKYRCTKCDYGHAIGKSRQAVTNHFNKVHKEGVSENIINSSTSDVSVQSSDTLESTKIDSPSPLEEETSNTPSWLEFAVQESEDISEHESLPPIANSVLNQWSRTGGIPRDKENLKEFYGQQAKMMRWFFNGILDPLVSWYGKSVTSNVKFEIKRSEQEWQLFEGISQQWLEYRQIVLPVTPDVMMGACIGSFYVPQIYKIQKNKDKTKSFSPLSIFRRWRKRKKLKNELKRNPLNTNTDESPHGT
tara:strand:+ start:5868 stop:6641 length:774 start_codon:yes stop_codon:yes gene_type:complete